MDSPASRLTESYTQTRETVSREIVKNKAIYVVYLNTQLWS